MKLEEMKQQINQVIKQLDEGELINNLSKIFDSLDEKTAERIITYLHMKYCQKVKVEQDIKIDKLVASDQWLYQAPFDSDKEEYIPTSSGTKYGIPYPYPSNGTLSENPFDNDGLYRGLDGKKK